MTLLLSKDLLKGMKMLHLVRGSNIDFLKYALPAFIASWTLIFVGIGYGFYRGNDVLGVEFAGGNTITMNYTNKINVDQLRASAAKTGVGDVLIAYQRDAANNTENLSVTTRAVGTEKPGEGESKVDSADKVVAQFKADFPQAAFQVTGVDRVGPTVGAEIRTKAIYSALLALFGILVYVAFRYEFSFAVGAVVAIIHDILMTMGW